MPEYIVSPSTLTTRLAAVNSMIFTLGETGVDSLEPLTNADAQNALAVLDRVDLQVQDRGWHWNREDQYPLTLSPEGYLVLPNNTLRVTAAYGEASDVVQRGEKLYDRTNHTSVFTSPLKVDFIARLSWDELPQSARMYVLLRACSVFHASLQERSILLRVNDSDIADALVTLEQAEDEVARTNTSKGSMVINTLGGSFRNRRGSI